MSSRQTAGLYARVPRPVRHELPRPDLLRRLHRADVPLVVLVAPGGYGKTTLLAQFARTVAGRVVWLSVREGDADPLLLCERIAGAVMQVLPTLDLLHYHKAHAAGKPPALLASALASDLARSTTNLECVLDGADGLGVASGRWLGAWVDELPEGHRVFLSVRTAPHLGLPRRVAAATALQLGIQDLAFTAAETAACLQAASSAADPADLHGQLEGWPLAVNVVASRHEMPHAMSDVLQDALRSLPVEVLTVLPELGVLDVWTEVRALDLGVHLPPGWPDILRQAGLPLTPIAEALRPHALLREQLETLLRRNGARHAELHGRAGQGAEAQGQDWQALTHYRLAGWTDHHLRLARTLALRYQERWEPRLIVQALESLPPDVLPEDLTVLLAKALIDSGDVARGRAVTERLHAEGVRRPDLYFVRGALAARAGEDEQLLQLAEAGLACSHDHREACRLMRLKAAALFNLGRLGDAATVARAALDLARAGGDWTEAGAVLNIVQLIHKARQEWTECEAALRAALRIYAEAGMPARALMLQNNLADLLLRQGRTAEALEIVTDALPVAAREQSVVMGLLQETLGELHGRQGRAVEARTAFQQALAVYEAFEISAFVSRVWPALLEMTLRGGDAAEARLLTAQWAMTAPAAPHAQEALSMCRGLLAFHGGRWPDAAAAFTQVTDGDLKFRAALLAAEARRQAGTFGRSQAEGLQALLDQAQPYQFWPGDAPVLGEVTAACGRLGVPVSAAEALLAALTLTRQVQPGRAATPLRIQTLGQVQVTVDGEPVYVPLTRSTEVLVWLALHGEGSRGEIMNDLWNGSNEQRHIEYFKVAVRHLRLALSSVPAVTFNPVPFEHGRYRLATEFMVDLDVHHVGRALSDPTDEGLQSIVDAYRGPFLPASDAEWVDVRRADLLEQALTAAMTLARRLGQDDPVRAAALLERCLDLDPLHEDAHLQLIRCWEARGEREAARRCYTRYARMLTEEWQRAPDRDLQARYAHR